MAVLYQFEEGQALSLVDTAFAEQLRDRTALRKANGADADAWPDYAGIGGLRRFGLSRVLTRPGAAADTCLLDASTDWRDRLLVVFAFAHRVLASGPAAFPGHPNDVDYESLGCVVGYTRDGADVAQAVGARHIRLATGVHLYAISDAVPTKEGALAIDVLPTAGHERMTVGIIVWASERLGLREAAPPPVPALLAADATTIAPADLNLLQDPVMLAQFTGGIAGTSGPTWNESEAIPLGSQLRPDRGVVGPHIPRSSTRRTNDWDPSVERFVEHERRQKVVGSHKRFFALELANGEERALDSSIDWRQRFIAGMGRVHTAEMRPGEATDTDHNTASSWERAGFTGPGLRAEPSAPRMAAMAFIGGVPAGYLVAPPNHALFLDAASKISLFADSTDGKLYCRNDSGGTRWISGFVEASEPVGQSQLPKLADFGDRCLSFDGTNDYVEIPDHTTLSNTTAFTFDAWVYQDAASGTRVIAAKGPNPAVAYLIQIGTTTLRVCLGNTGDFGECAWPSVAAWHHLCVVYDSGGTTDAERLQVYIDGAVQALAFTGAIPAVLPDVSEPGQIGAWNGSVFFNGDIDEVAWYAFPLTASEAAQNYQRRRVTRGLTSLWKFDEPTGSTVEDTAQRISGWAAATPNNGTNNGATRGPHA